MATPTSSTTGGRVRHVRRDELAVGVAVGARIAFRDAVTVGKPVARGVALRERLRVAVKYTKRQRLVFHHLERLVFGQQ